MTLASHARRASSVLSSGPSAMTLVKRVTACFLIAEIVEEAGKSIPLRLRQRARNQARHHRVDLRGDVVGQQFLGIIPADRVAQTNRVTVLIPDRAVSNGGNPGAAQVCVTPEPFGSDDKATTLKRCFHRHLPAGLARHRIRKHIPDPSAIGAFPALARQG
jgi:hypothetical protein